MLPLLTMRGNRRGIVYFNVLNRQPKQILVALVRFYVRGEWGLTYIFENFLPNEANPLDQIPYVTLTRPLSTLFDTVLYQGIWYLHKIYNQSNGPFTPYILINVYWSRCINYLILIERYDYKCYLYGNKILVKVTLGI